MNKKLEFYTTSQLSESLHVSKQTIIRWAKEKYLPHIKIGRKVLFPPDEVGKWLRGHQGSQPTKIEDGKEA